MKDMDTNKIIVLGMVAMGVIAVGGWIALSVIAGTSSGTEIPIGIVGTLGGALTGKHLTEKKYENWTPPPNDDCKECVKEVEQNADK